MHRGKQRKTNGHAPHMYTVAELFCGCGGLSHGFGRSGRFRVVFGNDVKPAALQTFTYNHSRAQEPPETIRANIRTVPIDGIIAALEQQGVGEGELDCLAGGPPCQGFSQMRRSEERKANRIVRFKGYNQLDEDPRNDLVLRFLEIANAIKPKTLLIENVPQMLRHGHNGKLGGLATNVKRLLMEMGYSVVADIINAADYGVPQLRERVAFLASRVGDASLPPTTHRNPEDESNEDGGSKPGWRTVEDAISDLPLDPPAPEDLLGGGPVQHYPCVHLTDYAKLMRSEKAFPYNHVTRAYNRRIISIIQEMRPGETWDSASERMQRRYAKLIEHHSERGRSIEGVKKQLAAEGKLNPIFYKRYYWSAYTRLAWNRPALTITANANFLGSGRFTHPARDRGVTMREAARLQSFDDDFVFLTAPSDRLETKRIGIGMDMIGEAVPPLLSTAFGQHIAALLDEARGCDISMRNLPQQPLAAASGSGARTVFRAGDKLHGAW